ncbi:LysR family transcriptional regulator [Pseudomonas costantinii]|uniref:DNA-binding transcriptional regulator, LysR family n=1 Tax=Pseudomonas costantinii TaxID=168469 RepID=A0A1H4ZH53_9PSED|nr:LysR substrate-binding domain-containing protein [Pseudomonas costantinii]NVZ22728.1 LysR family transcriptional regulator [Pseudomonas costantinii]SED29307.1 DNA-binding transcriptional regulator, LysR family [Pseudomonas costantinii]
MELVWLEDFSALAEYGSFVRAAEARHVTQPAFSRRVRSLENWMGVELFIRTPQGATLTEAGKQILLSAQETTRRLYRMRSDAQETAGMAAKTLQFAATHSLSFTFFPKWLRSTENGAPIEAVRLHSDNMSVCEQMLIQGQVQFLLCHRHPEVPPLLAPDQFIGKKIGDDVLVPLMSASAQFDARPSSVPYLAYTQESGLGRIVAHRLHGKEEFLHLKPLFSSHLAAVLMSMAMENKGVAWLPRSLTEQEVNDGRLVRALDESWDIPLEIHLTRPNAPMSPSAEEFWAKLKSV